MRLLISVFRFLPPLFMAGANLYLFISLIRSVRQPTTASGLLEGVHRYYYLGGYFSIITYIFLWITGKNGGIVMAEKIAQAMHFFAMVYSAAGIAVLATLIGAAWKRNQSVSAVKGLFLHCLLFAAILWLLAWLIG